MEGGSGGGREPFNTANALKIGVLANKTATAHRASRIEKTPFFNQLESPK